MPKERDSVKPKISRTHVCAWWISYNFLLKLGRRGSFTRNIPLDTSHSDDRQHKNESDGSSSGLSSGDSVSRDINPAFDSESQDEVITLGPGCKKGLMELSHN